MRILFWVWTWLFRWRIKHCKKKHFWNAVSGSREEKFSSVWTLLHQFRSFVDRIYKYVFIKSWNVHVYFESLYLETFFSLRLSEFSCTFENLTENRGWKLYFLYGNDPKNIYTFKLHTFHKIQTEAKVNVYASKSSPSIVTGLEPAILSSGNWCLIH